MIRLLIFLALLVVLQGGRAAGQPASPSRSSDAGLDALWRAYRDRYVLPPAKSSIRCGSRQVTSEAQSYALVRAVWMRDRATFERVLAWTDAHLRRPDGLYAWLWDPATARVLDANSATDGDIEIAYALAMASVVFDRPAYATQARDIVRAIRTQAIGSTTPAAGFRRQATGRAPSASSTSRTSTRTPRPGSNGSIPEGGWDATSTAWATRWCEQALDAGPFGAAGRLQRADAGRGTPAAASSAMP